MNLIEEPKTEEAKTDDIICESQGMRKVIRLARMVASKKSTVLITGETGVGKNIIAKLIHDLSPRKAGPFKAVNCSALTETLLESELFGHVKGAFTGATESHEGLFKQATGGTLFLDEVGDMSPGLQARLLHTIETEEFRPVGGKKEDTADVRVIAATNVDLAEAVREKRFRIDLYYRLNVFPIHIPPLRERTKDILKLVDLFIEQFNTDEKEISGAESDRITGVTDEAEKYLKYATWVGNVRELRSAIEYAFIHHAKAGELQPTNFPKPQLELADASSVVPSEVAEPEPSDVAEPEPRESDAAAFLALMRFKTVSQENITDIYKPRNIERTMHTMGALIKKNVELGSLRRREMRSLGYAGDGTINNFFEHCKDLFFAEDAADRPKTTTEFIEKLRGIYGDPDTKSQLREWEESIRKAITDQNANNIPLFRT